MGTHILFFNVEYLKVQRQEEKLLIVKMLFSIPKSTFISCNGCNVFMYLSSWGKGEPRPESCPKEIWDVWCGMISDLTLSESRECRLLLVPLQWPKT